MEKSTLTKLITRMAIMMPLALSMGPVFGMNADERRALYDEARSHLNRGNVEAAYELLEAEELTLAGRDGFDYLLGVAALDSGRPGVAIFSFDRLLARRPNFVGARLDLARAYYDVGDYDLARIEFVKVRSENPPPQAEQTIERYLEAIRNQRKPGTESMTRWYLDFTTGYDSNAPAATDEELFLSFRLDPRNLEQSSSFSALTVGGLHARPAGDNSQLYFSTRLDHRINPSAHFVDTSNVDVGTGWNWNGSKQGFNIGINAIVSALDREYHKRDVAVTASYTRKLSSSWGFSSFVRGSDVRFDEATLSVRDVERFVGGVGITRHFSQGSITFNGTALTDDAKEEGSLFSNDGYGFQIQAEVFGQSGRAWKFAVGSTIVEYDDQFFGAVREDDTYTASLGMTWRGFPARKWTSSLGANYSRRDSTVDLYEFDRYEFSLSFQRMFD